MRKPVILTAADQFGDTGPQPGALGYTIGRSFDDEGDKWLHIRFIGYNGYFNVREDMIEVFDEQPAK